MLVFFVKTQFVILNCDSKPVGIEPRSPGPKAAMRTLELHSIKMPEILLQCHMNLISGRLTSLVYDDQDRLMFADVEQRRYYVVSDRIGSPCLFMTPTGKIIREIVRTPYGHVIADSEKLLGVDIGFAGGIYDPVTQLVHLQVKDQNIYFSSK